MYHCIFILELNVSQHKYNGAQCITASMYWSSNYQRIYKLELNVSIIFSHASWHFISFWACNQDSILSLIIGRIGTELNYMLCNLKIFCDIISHNCLGTLWEIMSPKIFIHSLLNSGFFLLNFADFRVFFLRFFGL